MKIFRINSHKGYDRLASLLQRETGEKPHCHYLLFSRPERPGYFFIVPDALVAEARRIKGVSATRLTEDAIAPCIDMKTEL